MSRLEPLKFKPIYKYRIWGGEQLKSHLNKSYDETMIGESWELSGVPGDVSVVSEGIYKDKNLNELISEFGTDLLGRTVLDKFGSEFPILIKFIDAAQDLSIQVHPGDDLAKKRHNSFGKTEMWYVLKANQNANLIVGFKQGVNQEDYLNALNLNKIESILNKHSVKEGDTFLIPTGTIHAIGAGVMVAEIQQTSDITYRVYDFNRKDKDGNTRELHTDLAVDALDYNGVDGFKQEYQRTENQSNQLVHSPYFKTNFIPVKGSYKLDLSTRDSFTILMAVKGTVELIFSDKSHSLKLGETILIPAQINELNLEGTSNLLEVFL